MDKAHDFEACRQIIISEVDKDYMKTSTYWNNIVRGIVVTAGLSGAVIASVIIWGSHVNASIRVDEERISQLEAAISQITEMRDDLKADMETRKQLIDREEQIVSKLEERIR